jgi:hypothetical protein
MQGWLWILTTSLVGESIIAWQLFGILTRWLSSLALWWVLRSVWPKQTTQVTLVAILFLAYPGFLQQYIPITYSHMFIVLTMFLLSLGMMIWAYRKPAWFWPLTIFSLTISALSMFTLEYFVGLELLRPALLWLALEDESGNLRKRAHHVFMRWLPYLAVLMLFVIWRILNKTPRADVVIFNQLGTNTLATLLQLGKTIIKDMIEASLIAWWRTIDFANLLVYRKTIILMYAAIVLGSFAATVFFLFKFHPIEESSTPLEPSETSKPSAAQWGKKALLLGLYALFIAGWPIWVTNLYLELRFPWDRFTLAMMPGVALLWSGLVALLFRNRWYGAVVVGILVGLAAGNHFQNGLLYMREWTTEKDFFRQLIWRVPGIKPGTTVIVPELPFAFDTDNSLTAPLNWIYAPSNSSRQMSYLMMNIDARLGNRLPGLEKDLPIHEFYRVTSFEGSTSQALILFYAPPHCVKVFDPVTDHFWPNKPNYISADTLDLSDPSMIIVNANSPASLPINIFGPETEHDWCYYFEKAELARQKGDWNEIVRLSEQVFKLKPTYNGAELMPFIEGYIQTGQWEKAVKLSLEAYRLSDKMQYMLCDRWVRLEQNATVDISQQAAMDQIKSKLQCELPGS